MAHIDYWKNEAHRSHDFSGKIYSHELSMEPKEVIERVKDKIVCAIANQIMREVGPIIEIAVRKAIEEARKD